MMSNRSPARARLSFAAPAAAFFVFALATAAAPGETGSADRLVRLDGTVLEGTVAGIDAEGAVTLAGAGEPMQLSGLRRIERPVASDPIETPQHSTAVVELAGGGRVIASSVKMGDELVRATWKHGEFAVSIDSVRAIRFAPAAENDLIEKALAGESKEFDRIYLKADGGVQEVRGLVESLDEKTVTFEWQGRSSTLERERLQGIVMAAIGGAPERTGQALVSLTDGSAVWGRVVSLKTREQGSRRTGTLRIDGGGREVELPWEAVTRLSVRSDRLQYVSDLKPVEASEQPIVTGFHQWRRDRSTGGGPLTLGGRVYEKGIGVHSRSELTFSAGRDFTRFAAVIGVDDETGGRGDCEFVVLGDGRELFRKRMKGGEEPQPVRVDIGGVERVTLLVEPGADLDLSDHADWADAVFIRPAD